MKSYTDEVPFRPAPLQTQTLTSPCMRMYACRRLMMPCMPCLFEQDLFGDTQRYDAVLSPISKALATRTARDLARGTYSPLKPSTAPTGAFWFACLLHAHLLWRPSGSAKFLPLFGGSCALSSSTAHVQHLIALISIISSSNTTCIRTRISISHSTPSSTFPCPMPLSSRRAALRHSGPAV